MTSRVPGKQPGFASSEKSDAVHDLTQLQENNPDNLLQVLRYRFQNDQIYTQIGSRILTSFNPNKPLTLYDEHNVEAYNNDYKDSSGKRPQLPPHIYQFAATVYFHLRRSGLDQAVIFCGNSGSGKTQNQTHFLRELAAIRSTSKKESKLYDQVLSSETIFQAFGSAITGTHKTASQFGKYMELQFDSRGRTIGVKTLEYLLQKSRVTHTPRSESNFPVFYQLIAGVTTEERAHFQLQDPSHYHYLQGTATAVSDNELSKQFQELKSALKLLGFNRKYQSQIFQLLAAILHLGNVHFVNPTNQTQEAAMVKNDDVLNVAADFLGLLPSSLESLLTYKTKLIKKELCTVFLDAEHSAVQRDDLVKCLYSLLFSWIIEYMNTRLCKQEQANFIGLLDLPGFQKTTDSASFEIFCYNYANERMYRFMSHQVFEASNDAYVEDGIQVPSVSYSTNQAIINLLNKSSNGIISILNKQANKVRGPATDPIMLQAIHKTHGDNQLFNANLGMNEFTIRHFSGTVNYSAQGFMEKNMDSISPDFVFIFRGGSDIPVGNPFVSGLFTSDAVTTESHPRNTETIVAAQQPTIPLRQPSMKRPRVKATAGGGDGEAASKQKKVICATSQFQTAMDELFDTFDNTESWFVICLRPNQDNLPNQFNSDYVADQIHNYSLCAMADRKKVEYTVCYQHDEFVTRYRQVLEPVGIDPSRTPMQVCQAAQAIFGWAPEHFAIGNQFTYLSDVVWRDLEDNLRNAEKGEIPSAVAAFGGNDMMNMPQPPFYQDDARSYFSDEDNIADDQQSYIGRESKYSASQDGDIQLTKAENNLKIVDEDELENEKPPKTKIRKSWICFTWFLTWWIPTSFLSCCGRMKLKDVRMAWREKVSLCICIFFICAVVVLFIVGINPLICPTLDIYSSSEVQDSNTKTQAYVSAHGGVYDLNKLGVHQGYRVEQMIKLYAGKAVDGLFPMQLSTLCSRSDGTPIDPRVALQNYTNPVPGQDPNAQYHDKRYYKGDSKYDPNYYQYLMTIMNKKYKVGALAIDPTTIQQQAQTQSRSWVILDNKVYDLNDYTTGNIYSLVRENESPASQSDMDFLDSKFTSLVQAAKGTDITNKYNILYKDDPQTKAYTTQCLKEIFYAGDVDTRNSLRCIFAQYILLALSIFLFAILFVKFLASLQLGSRPEPEDHDKFVICNVPCYTEDEESLRRTIDSLAVLKYDDKRKLLFIVADGMVVGGGNDVPTPRIVLDILGSDANADPEPLSFFSLGEGLKQHNMGKVYTGLYECSGHVVPYLVVVKVGKPSERSRPGNRGKRDSQLILMHFFNKVHYDYPMNPLELEMYHQIKNVIGVDPHFYEYVLMVDADTVVLPDSLNRLISAMLHDTKIMGICGETSLSNEKDTWATMIQVYEYFISHHLAKAFESLFGSVTCLPGCFCMYRIRAPNKNIPLLVSNIVVNEYSENRVDTLHKKNLLHLGEDRYLTTLMLKHFPLYKMTFTPDAKCLTNAPDTWSVLLSQRRRWINSTVHNLLELIFLPRLCGFCCFSMRFVVFMDLFSTVIMPATLGYLGYLLYRLITDRTNIPIYSLAFVIAPYALQMIVFIIKRQWQHIGWMIVYLLSLPVFAFFIPIYAFWHFDDFSWGNTRVVLGEGNKKKIVTLDEGKFDPKSIPVKRWTEYEEELWEAGTQYSHESKQSGYSHRTTDSQVKKGIQSSSSVLFPTPQPMGAGAVGDYGYFPPSSPVPRNSNMSPVAGSRPGSRMNLLGNSSVDMRPVSTADSQANYPPYSGIPLNTLSSHNVYNPLTSGSSASYAMPPPQGSPYYRPSSRNGSGIFEQHSRAASPNPMGGAPIVPGHSSPNPAAVSTPGAPTAGYPTETDIASEVKRILSTANLMNITKKQVRDELTQSFAVDMTPHKEFINQCIEMILQGQL